MRPCPWEYKGSLKRNHMLETTLRHGGSDKKRTSSSNACRHCLLSAKLALAMVMSVENVNNVELIAHEMHHHSV